MIHTAVFDADSLIDPQIFAESLAGVSSSRRDKVMFFKFEKDRRLSLAAGLLLEAELDKRGLSAGDIKFGRFGKPEVPDFFFNLSHSGHFAVISVSDFPVGVDIEECREVKDDFIKSVTTQCEQEAILPLRGAERTKRFFSLWTVKESFMKCLGTGISLPPKEIEVCFGDEISIRQNISTERFYFREYPVEGGADAAGYCLTVCGTEREFCDDVKICRADDFL